MHGKTAATQACSIRPLWLTPYIRNWVMNFTVNDAVSFPLGGSQRGYACFSALIIGSLFGIMHSRSAKAHASGPDYSITWCQTEQANQRKEESGYAWKRYGYPHRRRVGRGYRHHWRSLRAYCRLLR